ncbi:MAG TPA: DUF2760 domain-containing protein, partial [Fimbriiglobus sp.]|nr:DUF2760 domain-containing protein [Fimbriiglobus sp.]
MDMFLLGLAVGAALAALLFGVMAVARAGSVGRAFMGLTVAGRASADPAFAARLDELMGGAAAPPKPTGPPKPSGEPLRLLALLQAEARLVDFLMEDISAAGDAQVGQAVRDIHRKAQQALKQHLTLETVLPHMEGEQVTVPPGFDPSAVRVVGNVTGQPPFTG